MRVRGGRLAAGLIAVGLVLSVALIVPPSLPSLILDPPASLIAAALPVTLALLLALAASIAALARLDSLAASDATPPVTESHESSVVLEVQRRI